MPRPHIDPRDEGLTEETVVFEPFNPEKHLIDSAPARILTMEDIDLPADTGISPVAVSEPFPLFSKSAIRSMRAELFGDKCWSNCQYSSNINACQLRGMCPKIASFVHDAWTNPATLEIISRIAGIDLVPSMDFEIGHVNVSVKPKTMTGALSTLSMEENGKPIVAWHTDSYPFVCVLMMSDASNMVGGETALRTGTGKILKVRGPQMGSAIVLQGRYIEHQALQAQGADERITMVTAFRPRSFLAADDTTLSNVRPVSNLQELYYQFYDYRARIILDRFRLRQMQLADDKQSGKMVDFKAEKRWLQEQINFLSHTMAELVDEEDVIMGYVGDPFPVSAAGHQKGSAGERMEPME